MNDIRKGVLLPFIGVRRHVIAEDMSQVYYESFDQRADNSSDGRKSRFVWVLISVV